MADACVFLMNLPDAEFTALLGQDESRTGVFEPPVVNIGMGEDLSIAELAALVKEVVGFKGEIELDPSKPDGTPRKLLDTSRLTRAGWRPRTTLSQGLRLAYDDFVRMAAAH